MSFEHRKYHWSYFVLGMCLAVILATMLSGCEQGKTDKGRDCWGMAGMTVEGEQCEPIDYPPPWDEEPPIACCAALMPECEACKDGCTVEEWLVKTCGINATDAEYAYWDDEKNEPVWLCQAVIIN